MDPETPQEQANRIRSIADKTVTSIDAFKADVKTLTEEDLNALADHFLRERKDQLSNDVKAEMKTRLDALDAATVGENLDELLERIPKVREALKTNADRLHDDMKATEEMVTGTVGSAYDYVKTNVLNPLIKQTEGVFIIGPLLGSLGELSPSQIKNAIAKKWYKFVSSSETLASSDSTGFFSTALKGIAKNAKINLAFIGIEEAIAEQTANHPANETIAFDKKNVSPQDMEALAAMSETELKDKVTSLIVKNRESGVRNINVTYADLSITQEKLAEQANAQRIAALEKKILDEKEWKAAGVTSVKFSSEEVSFEKGILTVTEAGLDTAGIPKSDSREKALLDARTVLSAAEKIIIETKEKDTITVDWGTPKTVTLPRKTPDNLSIVNDIVSEGSLGEFSILQIEGKSDYVREDEVLIERKTINDTPVNVLITENSADILNAIKSGRMKNVPGDPPSKYQLENNAFTLLTPSMPTTSQTA